MEKILDFMEPKEIILIMLLNKRFERDLKKNARIQNWILIYQNNKAKIYIEEIKNNPMFVFEKWNSKQYINGHLVNRYTDEEMKNFYY